MIALKCPVCGNPVDEAIDGGCTKRCDDIFHGKDEEEMTHPTGSPETGSDQRSASEAIRKAAFNWARYEIEQHEKMFGDRHKSDDLPYTQITINQLRALTSVREEYDITKARYYVTEARRNCWKKEKLESLLDNAIEILNSTALTSGWQDISTAPKDGTEVIGRIGDKSFAMSWQDKHYDGDPAGWCYASYTWGGVLYKGNNNLIDQPTHWMPLPAAPNGGAE